jgi:Nuclease-related domain
LRGVSSAGCAASAAAGPTSRPGHPGSRANADHLVIGPPGVFLIDSKHYRGRLTLTREGSLWYGHHSLAGILATVRWEAAVLDQALGATVISRLCVHGAQLPGAN